MRLAEPSEHSGVPTATIRYHLRERLQPAGRRITATRSAYDKEHLRRLRLVRALIQVGRMPVSAAREVLAAVEGDSLDQLARPGVAVEALPHGSEPDESSPSTAVARHTATELPRRCARHFNSALADSSRAFDMLVAAIAALHRLGYACGTAPLLPYAQQAAQLAVVDLDLVEEFAIPPEQMAAAVALTVLYEPVLLSLRRPAGAEESNKRYGSGS
ncbi:MerR family transcriptional regulator [Streptomyces sioyaensis]|uniref:MerR family transcriptional regulator n=1 Tax=Streptomyces sioyaensis TaxID=67364 RepID=UPI0037D7BEB3